MISLICLKWFFIVCWFSSREGLWARVSSKKERKAPPMAVLKKEPSPDVVCLRRRGCVGWMDSPNKSIPILFIRAEGILGRRDCPGSNYFIEGRSIGQDPVIY